MQNPFYRFSEWKTSAIVFKKRYFIGGLVGLKGENDFKALPIFSRK